MDKIKNARSAAAAAFNKPKKVISVGANTKPELVRDNTVTLKPELVPVDGVTTPVQDGQNLNKIKKKIKRGLVRNERRKKNYERALGQYESGIKFVTAEEAQPGDIVRLNKLCPEWFLNYHKHIQVGSRCIYLSISPSDKLRANEGRYIYVMFMGDLEPIEVLTTWISKCNDNDDDVE